MNDLTDQQLLRDYAARRTESAFAELVRRYVDFVYSAARRMVRDAHLAEDVTQSAFAALAQNAGQLADRAVLSGWLHRTAQNLAANVVRSEVRRRAREQEAAAMNEIFNSDADSLSRRSETEAEIWEHIAPQLDDALGELSEADRDALLLRYFQRQSARDMAQTLGVSEDAAQKRVTRALERLRENFAQRGITVGAGGLGVVITANAVQAAPLGLAATISTAALTGTAISTSTAVATTKIIAMTALQKMAVAALSAALVAVAATGFSEKHQAAQLRAQNESLAQQIAQLEMDKESLSNQIAEIGEAKKLSAAQFNELLKLRGEVGVLRRQLDEAGNLRAENQRLMSALKQAEDFSAPKSMIQPTALKLLRQRFKEESEQILTLQTNLDSLRKEYNIVDNQNNSADENENSTTTSPEQLYWLKKGGLDQMIQLHEITYAQMKAEEIDRQLKSQNNSN